MNVYVASSWRNERLDAVVARLAEQGHDVYDFRDACALDWAMLPRFAGTAAEARVLMRHPAVRAAYAADKAALDACGAVVLVLPCGRSAHLEAGYAAGQGKPVWVLLADGDRLDIMHLVAAPRICAALEEVLP